MIPSHVAKLDESVLDPSPSELQAQWSVRGFFSLTLIILSYQYHCQAHGPDSRYISMHVVVVVCGDGGGGSGGGGVVVVVVFVYVCVCLCVCNVCVCVLIITRSVEWIQKRSKHIKGSKGRHLL